MFPYQHLQSIPAAFSNILVCICSIQLWFFPAEILWPVRENTEHDENQLEPCGEGGNTIKVKMEPSLLRSLSATPWAAAFAWTRNELPCCCVIPEIDPARAKSLFKSPHRYFIRTCEGAPRPSHPSTAENVCSSAQIYSLPGLSAGNLHHAQLTLLMRLWFSWSRLGLRLLILKYLYSIFQNKK